MFSQDIFYEPPKLTIKEIFNSIESHCDGGLEYAYVCIFEWANRPGGILKLNDKPIEQFINKYHHLCPDDWCLTFDEDRLTFHIGFLFKHNPFEI